MVKLNANALNIKNEDGTWSAIAVSGAGGTIDIDTALDENSDNAIANGAVAIALNEKISANNFATDEDIDNLYITKTKEEE